MDNILEKILRIDLLEKYSIIKNEVQTAFIILDYLSRLSWSGEFFKRTFEATKALKKEIDGLKSKVDISLKNLEKGIWQHINDRAYILRQFKLYIDTLGVIQKAIAERLDCFPHFYPPPPMLRQKEIFKAVKLIDQTINSYHKRIFEIDEEKSKREETEFHDNHILGVWDYAVDDKFILLRRYETWQFIKSTYWIILLPNYLPILAHEIAHKYIHKNMHSLFKNTNLKELGDNIRKIFGVVYSDVNVEQFIKNFITEILSDIYAYLIAGPPYVFSLFSYLLRERINYQFLPFIQSFPFLRLNLLTSIALKNQRGYGSKRFAELLRSIKRMCDEYYQLLSNVEMSVSEKLIPPSPDIFKNTELKIFLDNALFNVTISHLEILSRDRVRRKTNMDEEIAGFLNKFSCDDLQNRSTCISWKSLNSIGVKYVEDIPWLLWHEIILTEEKENRFRTGRLCQEVFRIISDKRENKVQFPCSLKKEAIALGEIVEFLFIKVNWSSLLSGELDHDDSRSLKKKVLEHTQKDVIEETLASVREHLKDDDKGTVSDGIRIIDCYHLVGPFDLLVISTRFSIKKDLEWPPVLAFNRRLSRSAAFGIEYAGKVVRSDEDDASVEKCENNYMIRYFPKSEVFQEILLPESVEYRKGLEDFLDNSKCCCLFQITLKRDESEGSSSGCDLMTAINKTFEVLLEEVPLSKIFLLKSIGWEDIVILIRDFDTLETVKNVKQKFSKQLRHSLTTVFFKDTNSIKDVRLGNVLLTTLLKVKSYPDLYDLRVTERYVPSVITGAYDCELKWKFQIDSTMKDLNRQLFKFIEEWGSRLGIIDINTYIGFPLNTQGQDHRLNHSLKF